MSLWRSDKVDGRVVFSQWLLNRIRWLASIAGAYGSICALTATLLAIAILLIVSLIPLFLNNHGDEAVGELYCINNYSMVVGFQIPQYNTSFTITMTSATASSTTTATVATYTNFTFSPTNNGTFELSDTIGLSEYCGFQLLSIVYPSIPNAKVYDNYALSEACYRTLQSCYYDPLLSSCLLSDCIASEVVGSSINASYPLTYYRLRCTAKIYYKTRCTDSPASYHLYYSSSQQNSACRQQRLNRINTCLNSSIQLSSVPCLISVSSAKVTNQTADCNYSVTTNTINAKFYTGTRAASVAGIGVTGPSGSLKTTFTSTIFTASDQDDGHVYRISSVNSETYNSSQSGALYCGSVTLTQIASSITAAISSQG